MGFPGDSVVKNPPASARDMGLIPGLRRSPGEGNTAHSVFLPGKSHGEKSLAGYSPWDHKRVRQDLSITQQLPVVEGQFASTIAPSDAYCLWTLGLHRHYQTIKRISFSFLFIGKDWVSFPVSIIIHCSVIFITTLI